MSIDKFGNDSAKVSKHQGVNPTDAKSAQDIREKKKAQEIEAQLQKGLSGAGFEDDFGYGDNVVFTSQGAVSVNPEYSPIQPIDTKINSPEKLSVVADEKVVERNKNSLTGNVGVIIFNPNRFVDAKNTPEQISAISDLLEQVDVPKQLKKALIEALEDGKVAFAHNEIGEDGRLQNPEEILTLTEGDIELILDYTEKTSDIYDKNALLEQERLFRKEYLASHSEKLSINDVDPNEVAFVQRAEKPDARVVGFGRTNVRTSMPEVPNLMDDPDVSVSFGAKFKKQWEYALKAGQDEYDTMGKRYAFATVKDKGINPYLSDGSIAPDTDRALAEYASKVAAELSTAGYCFTGVKYSLFTSGVLGNYGSIVDENGKMISTPREAMDWFADRPEMFQEIKYIPDEEGNLRELNSADLYDLPPGYIVLWAPEEGEQYAEEAGHIGITNGNGQAYGDHTDGLHWEDYAKAEHGTFRVFKLNDANWNYNSEIEKLEYVGPETAKIKADRELTQKLNYNDRSEKAKLFSDTLDENKQLLMETLNLSEEDYDSYSKLAKAISIVETRAGNDREMKLLDAMENVPFVNRVATSIYGTLSAGMTQIKVSDFAPAEKKILEKLGVQTGDMNNLDNPKYSALATMVHINTLMKSYKAYLSNDDIGIIKDEKLLSPEESATLEKFKSVLSDGEQWNKIIEVKDVLQGKAEPSSPEIAELVEGAKLFVDTNVEKLDPEEYIAARWNGKRRTKSEKEASLNIYYDNMLQVHIDRTRMKMENGEKVDLPVGVLSSPDAYSYITAVKYNSKRV